MVRPDKPKKSSSELVEILKGKGITFDIINETEAAAYLEKNNYLRTAAYRRNFEKNQLGENAGKYTKLDFAYLAELSSIDKQLRAILLNMCIDAEHALKSKLLSAVENNPDEDGYNIVDAFFKKYPKIIGDIEKKTNAAFTENLIDSYFSFCYVFSNDVDENGGNRVVDRIVESNCPVWVLVELISFGDVLNLIYLNNEMYPEHSCDIVKYNELSPVKSLRNACAHNNCLLINMGVSKTTRPTGGAVGFVQKMGVFSPTEISKKLACRPMFEIVSLLKCYTTYVSANVRAKGLETLRSFVSTRMYQHIDYFEDSKIVKSSFDFLQKVLDNLA